jgi:hypothetical protein
VTAYSHEDTFKPTAKVHRSAASWATLFAISELPHLERGCQRKRANGPELR